ncbi:unnamed protein product [Peronospora belbahrii]|uniref:Uncharacterized protein n=1 Tax=Peronospora belbahrii TaxID=622444 RepID=A0AAU9L933_9STRA|nr:unnamed protein product [Peronospora belbahrii]
MSTAAHLETYGQTERVNRALKIGCIASLLRLRHGALVFPWPNNLVPAASLRVILDDSLDVAQTLAAAQREVTSPAIADATETPIIKRRATQLVLSLAIIAFVQQRQYVKRFMRNSITSAIYKHKASVDQRGRKNLEKFKVGDSFLL